MPTTPELPMWQILPTGDGHFQWTAAGGDPGRRLEQPPAETLVLGELNQPASRLPSMADIVNQARQKLIEGDDGDRGGVPMFRTGSGRSVSVSESSIRKARSVLGRGYATARGAATKSEDGGGDESFPMFRTGSGKSVTVRQSSIRKAAAVLEGAEMEKEDGGAEGLPMFRTGSGRSVTVRQSSITKASAVLEAEDIEKGATVLESGGSDEGFPMFRTGLGKSVMVNQSSIRKAAAVLEGENIKKESLNPIRGGSISDGAAMFCTGSGRSVLLKPSSIKKAHSVLQDGPDLERDQLHKHAEDGNCSFSNSLFQTASGKTVNLSSAGLLRASALLGFEGNNDPSTLQYSKLATDHSDSKLTTTGKNSHVKLRWDVISGTSGSIIMDPMDVEAIQRNSHTCPKDFFLSGNQLTEDSLLNPLGFEMHSSGSTQPHIKFNTAGGTSILISSDALKRAKSLLGDSEYEVLQNDVKADQPPALVLKDERNDGKSFWSKENISSAFLHQNAGEGKSVSKPLPHVQSLSNQKESSHPLQVTNSLGVTLDQVNAGDFVMENIHHSRRKKSHMQLSKKDLCVTHTIVNSGNMIPECRPPGGPLVDISNDNTLGHTNMNQLLSEKKRLRRRSSISPFKRPRCSRFTTPLNSSISSLTTDSSMLSTENCCQRVRVSTRYPFQFKRKSIKDFFGECPGQQNMLAHLPDEVKHMNAHNAVKYKFHDESGRHEIGPEAFQTMLLQSGASLLSATKEWVTNHYKWIVWKLASLERCYPAQAGGKYLTVSNVLEELKYRYEREVNYGHRSAIKKILDGDASPSSMMVLCVSAIHYSETKISKMDDVTGPSEDSNKLTSSITDESNCNMKIELTDGWYSLDAFLDVLLSNQVHTGKLVVGQKLRIWGAGLQGWVAPVSSLEASKTVHLQIHINGTYRTHWADPLGFCKGLGAPLAFNCIKAAGGKVPMTLVGVTRIYPILYKERFPDGGSIVRSERMENKALQIYHQRRSKIAEDIMSEQQDVCDNVNDSDEGAKILKLLETAAEPEVLMADMSSEQLISFSIYQAKQKALRQSNTEKKIEKAFEDAGLSLREVTPLMRVRVVGLTRKGSCRKGRPREGLITIWNPTEKQKVDLVEGKMYSVAGLVPLTFGTDVLYLQARGSSTEWKPMCAIETEKFEPFFTPRKSVTLSNLGEVPLASEFDIAAVILHVGEVYISGCQKRQWIFMTDGSTCSSESLFEGQYDCLLAVNFCSPIIDNDSSALFSHTYSGNTVGFCNLVKRARDQMNHLWVAEATENSTYSVFYKLPSSFHLKEAIDSAQKWAKISHSAIQKLQERVLCIIGGHGA